MTSTPAFVGKIPALYDDLLGPLLFEPYAVDVAARLRTLDRGAVLETAAGTGIVTRALRRTLPASVRIVATDLSAEMLEHASSRGMAAGSPPVTWRAADAQSLPFGDGEFAAMVCQFGMMFLPKKPAGFAEASRVLERGGRFVFSVWDRLDRNEASQVAADAVKRLFPSDPPTFYERVPFAYWDESRIRDDASGAAFARIELETVTKTTRATAATAAVGLCQGTPLRAEIEARRPGGLDEVTARVEEALVAHYGGREFDSRMSAIVVTAVKS